MIQYNKFEYNVAKMSLNLDGSTIECYNFFVYVPYIRLYCGDYIIFHIVMEKCEHSGFMIKSNYFLMF